jgi:16S rRNA pseudouridine516 synthase
VRRLDQWLANLGYCSRREAKSWLEAGRVTVAGRPARDPSARCAAAEVHVDGEPLDHPQGLLLLLNKPAGVVCSHDAGEGRRVYDLLPAQWLRRNPALTTVGRLDRETTGLLLITDQTALVHRLTSPKSKLPKVYRVVLESAASPERQAEAKAAFASGRLTLPDEAEPCLPAQLDWLGPAEARVTLTEGRYHQVRRMFGAHGLSVARLHREQFGPWILSQVPEGSWIELNPDFIMGS